jgi:2,3-bisphosphoglycerate-independent phosphoglycerate mutase
MSREGDEWVRPTVVATAQPPAGRVDDGDAVLFFNFRSDRISQLADALLDHLALTRDVNAWSLAEYDTRVPIPALVSRADASGGLGDVLACQGLRSVRIAESEKFEHVTFYINGRKRQVSDVEEHVRIEGGSGADYRSHPEMNVDAVAEAAAAAAGRDEVTLVLANLANIDVVGHTGDAEATRRAAEQTDRAVGRVLKAARAAGRWVMLVGDHGNGEVMAVLDADGRQRPYGGHTTNPVPVVVLPVPGMSLPDELPTGRSLADVAPTILTLLGCSPSPVMTGRSLL